MTENDWWKDLKNRLSFFATQFASLPLEHPLKESLKIYVKRLAIFFAAVFLNLVWLGSVLAIVNYSVIMVTTVIIIAAILNLIFILFLRKLVGPKQIVQHADQNTIEHLIEVLKNENKYVRVRVRAASALGEIKDARAVEPLIEVLDDEDSSVRWNAAMALGQVGDARAVEPLIEALKDEDRIVRRETAMALVMISDARAAKHLTQALEDEDKGVLGTVKSALDKIKAKKN